MGLTKAVRGAATWAGPWKYDRGSVLNDCVSAMAERGHLVTVLADDAGVGLALDNLKSANARL